MCTKCMPQKLISFFLLNARIKYRIMNLLCANGSVNGMNKHNDELKLTSLLFFPYREITAINDEFLAKMRCFQLESSAVRMLLFFFLYTFRLQWKQIKKTLANVITVCIKCIFTH